MRFRPSASPRSGQPNPARESSASRHRRFPSAAVALVAAAIPAIAATLLPCSPARADSRAFTFSYETTTMPAGHVEYEQWVTWKASKSTDSDFDRIDFRHEVEFGITDNWQGAIYVSDWRYEDGDSVADDGVTWWAVAFETIYKLTDPIVDPLGTALYGELKIGDELIEFEGKLLLQKNLGAWIFVWNGVFVAEWEGGAYQEDKGKLEQTAGASYQFNPNWAAGGELIHEVEYDDWSQWGDHVVYAGPNVSYRSRSWWVTVTPMFQLTDIAGEPDFLTRVIFGIVF